MNASFALIKEIKSYVNVFYINTGYYLFMEKIFK